jgi:hypothetical protein
MLPRLISPALQQTTLLVHCMLTVQLCDDLHTEGLLTRQQATQAQHYVQAATNKHGLWKEGMV